MSKEIETFLKVNRKLEIEKDNDFLEALDAVENAAQSLNPILLEWKSLPYHEVIKTGCANLALNQELKDMESVRKALFMTLVWLKTNGDSLRFSAGDGIDARH